MKENELPGFADITTGTLMNAIAMVTEMNPTIAGRQKFAIFRLSILGFKAKVLPLGPFKRQARELPVEAEESITTNLYRIANETNALTP